MIKYNFQLDVWEVSTLNYVKGKVRGIMGQQGPGKYVCNL